VEQSPYLALSIKITRSPLFRCSCSDCTLEGARSLSSSLFSAGDDTLTLQPLPRDRAADTDEDEGTEELLEKYQDSHKEL
jgi:hypothetical protein